MLNRFVFLTLWLALTLSSLATPLESGMKALENGDYTLAQAELARVSGEPGQVARARFGSGLGTDRAGS